MHMGLRVFALAVLLVAGGVSQAFANAATPASAARAFYDLYIKEQVRDVPDDAARKKFAPLISAELNKALAEAGAAEKAHFIATKNEEPPLFQGDIFSSLFEGAKSYKLGQCAIEGPRAYCDIDLTYAEVPSEKPTTWTDKLALVKRAGGWKVDDIAFGATWDFGQHGHLRSTLAEIAQYGKE
ncbi:MAG: hypothetical protein Q7T44_05675 [Parvibaculum sp.]|nr:hypothetical protein [Parvibaculum sp.]